MAVVSAQTDVEQMKGGVICNLSVAQGMIRSVHSLFGADNEGGFPTHVMLRSLAVAAAA